MIYQRVGEPSKFMSISDIARMCGVSWHFGAKLVKEKKFPKPVKIGKTNYWIKDQVESYLANR